jgi:hypothetical protein
VEQAAWGGSWMDEDFGEEDFATGAGLEFDEVRLTRTRSLPTHLAIQV